MNTLFDKTKRTTRSRKMGDYDAFEAAAGILDMSERDLCEAIGYSRNACEDWKRNGKVPEVALMAANSLILEAQQGDAPTKVIVLVQIPLDQEEAIRKVLAAMDCVVSPPMPQEFLR